jgi:hypothetical protein
LDFVVLLSLDNRLNTESEFFASLQHVVLLCVASKFLSMPFGGVGAAFIRVVQKRGQSGQRAKAGTQAWQNTLLLEIVEVVRQNVAMTSLTDCRECGISHERVQGRCGVELFHFR